MAGVILAAWFYFVGWVYSYFYFRFFHVDIFEIDMPVEFVVVQSTSPIIYTLRHYWYLLLIFVLLIIAILFLALRNKRSLAAPSRQLLTQHKRGVELALAATVALILYYGGLKVAKVAGTEQAQHVWSAEAPEIQFSFAKDEAELMASSRLGRANDAYELRYLFATKDFYYVFIAEKPRVKNYIGDGMVFKVRNDAIDSVWIRRRGGYADAP